MRKMMAELKPCPFCGGEARLGMDFDWHFVYCIECQAQIERDYEKEAIDAWNRRAEDGK